MSQKLKYLGVPIYMNGQNYYIPSLSYVDFKSHGEFLSSAVELSTNEQMVEYFDKIVPVIGAAIRRNYPDITDEQLNEWLDMTTLPIAARAVQSASGLAPVSEGE